MGEEIVAFDGPVRSDFLFAEPSFLSGVARILDVGGTFDGYNISRDGLQADARALYADWRIVGQDLVRAAASAPRGPAPAP